MLHSFHLFNIFQDNELITYGPLKVLNYFFKYCYKCMYLNVFGFQSVVIIFLVENQIRVSLASKNLLKLASESSDMSIIVIPGSSSIFLVPTLKLTILWVVLVSVSRKCYFKMTIWVPRVLLVLGWSLFLSLF